MKKFAALVLALAVAFGAASALADNTRMDKLRLQFVPSMEADAIIAGTRDLPELVRAGMAGQGYDIGEVEISVGTSYEATGEALAAGAVDVGWLPGGTYAAFSRDGETQVILAATCEGISNDSEDPADWNGEENRTLPAGRPVTFRRALICAAPSEKGRALAEEVNAGGFPTWEELDDCLWAVGSLSSAAGYVYPSMWLMENYEGRGISDLSSVITLGTADAFAMAAIGQVDIICCEADGRCDYEALWDLPADELDEAGRQGLGREDSIWNEVNVIGVTDGIYNDTVAVTAARPEICDPDFIAALQTALIGIIGTEEGAAIFSTFGHTGYAVARDGDYDGARRALTAVK